MKEVFQLQRKAGDMIYDQEMTKYYGNCPGCDADIIIHHETSYFPSGVSTCPSCGVLFMLDSDCDSDDFYYSWLDLVTPGRLDVPETILKCELDTEVI